MADADLPHYVVSCLFSHNERAEIDPRGPDHETAAARTGTAGTLYIPPQQSHTPGGQVREEPFPPRAQKASAVRISK